MSVYPDDLEELIDGFDAGRGEVQTSVKNLTVADDGRENCVRVMGDEIPGRVRIRFTSSSSESTVIIGRNLRGRVSLNVRGKRSLIYIGDDCALRGVQVRSFQNEDRVLIGNSVTTAGAVRIVSGNGSGKSQPFVVIGDDCMLSYDITIRDTDAHKVVSGSTLLNTGELKQLNAPASGVIIEPHVWIGQNVSVLKDVRIGACSIVGLGSVVTRDLPRFSMANGVPAVATVRPDALWLRDQSPEEVQAASKYFKQFSAPGVVESSSSDFQQG